MLHVSFVEPPNAGSGAICALPIFLVDCALAAPRGLFQSSYNSLFEGGGVSWALAALLVPQRETQTQTKNRKAENANADKESERREHN